VSFAEADLRDFVSGDPFDAVVGRFVLMYLANPVEAVRHLAALVRPGGMVAFQEYQLTFECLSRPNPVPAWDQWLAWVLGALDRAGVEMQMGLRLYEVFTAAGLPPPRVEMTTHFLTPADLLGPRVAAHTVRSLLPFIERFGLATAEEAGVETYAERLHADLVARGAVVSWPPAISAWTQKEAPAGHP
jgi:SAM-dependent methyltransferase